MACIASSPGLSGSGAPGPRSDGAIPRRFVATDMTVVRRTVRIDLGAE